MHSRRKLASKSATLWAICPFIPLPDRPLISGPIVFDSRAKAQAFLNGASVLVYDGWGRGEEKNFDSREAWLQAIASVWIRPARERAFDITTRAEHGHLSREEIHQILREEQRSLTAWMNIRPVAKDILKMPSRLGSKVFVCSLEKGIRGSRNDLIRLPVPVQKLSDDSGPPCTLRLSDFKPKELNSVPVSRTDQLIDMRCSDLGDPWMYCLFDDWDFLHIAADASRRKGHRAHRYNVKLESLREHFWGIVLEIEESLFKRHPNLSAAALRAFWTSWQVSRHLDAIRRQIKKYVEVPGAVAGAIQDAFDAKELAEQNLRAFAAELEIEAIPLDAGACEPDHSIRKSQAGRSQPTGTIKPGPKRDIAINAAVRSIVKQVAGRTLWKIKLEEICKALDDADIPCPKTWLRRTSKLRNWVDGFETEPDLAKKAIQYRLKNTAK